MPVEKSAPFVAVAPTAIWIAVSISAAMRGSPSIPWCRRRSAGAAWRRGHHQRRVDADHASLRIGVHARALLNQANGQIGSDETQASSDENPVI